MRKENTIQLERREHDRALALGLTSTCAAAVGLKHAYQGSTRRRQTVEQQALERKP